MKHIYFIRHGETHANKNQTVPGKEELLNDTGHHQANELATRLSFLDFDLLVSSNFIRARETAEPIAKSKGVDIEIEPLFHEMVEPESLVGVSDDDEKILTYRKDRNEKFGDPSWQYEDGESHLQLFDRVTKARQYLENSQYDRIVVVSHGYFLMFFGAHILLNNNEISMDWYRVAKTLKVSNTGVSLMTYDQNMWRVVMWNDHAHFAE